MPDETIQAGPTEAEVLHGGVDLVVNFRNTKEGAGVPPRTVLVRDIPFYEIQALGMVWGGDMLAEVCLYIKGDIGPDDVKQLTNESFESVIKEGRRINRPTLRKFLALQKSAQEGIYDDATEKLAKAVEKSLKEQASPAS